MDWTKKEEYVIEKIFEDTQSIANIIDMALYTAFSGVDEHPFGQDLLVALGVKRIELDLLPDMKPGDIDILIVPFRGKALLEKILAIELKVVRPTIKKPGKNATSMGITQTNGLLRDGFPYVGLIHVLLPETSPTEDLILVPEVSIQVDSDTGLKPTGHTKAVDFFPVVCARRQDGRIQALELAQEAFYRVVGISTKNNAIVGYTLGEGRIGQINHNISLDLIKSVENLLDDKPELFRHIKWHTPKLS